MNSMPFDGVVLQAVTNELQEQIIGGRIDKIYEPTMNDLIITIRNNRKNYQLLISIHPMYARMHITDEKFINPEQPPLFCMVLRKHLIGARIDRIEQVDLERIVVIDLIGKDEIGDSVTYQLYVEIMGKHSNVIFIDKQSKKIVNAKKHVPPSLNRHRTILPGSLYVEPPEQNKLSLYDIDGETIVKKIDFNAGKIDRQIVQHVKGISPFLAREVTTRAHLGDMTAYVKQLNILKEEILEHRFAPAIYDGKREDFHVLSISYLKKRKEFETVSEMLDSFFKNKAERDRVQQQVKDLTRFLQNELGKNKRKLKIHEDTLKKSAQAENFQKQGELLTANMHLVKKGMKQITVVDYYDENQAEITIRLKEDLTPSENAQRFFSRYRKLLTAKNRAQMEINKTTEEINYLESVLQQLDDAREIDIEEIRQELVEQGYQKQRQQRRKKRPKPAPEKFISSNGTIIYVGRNNNQNEYVTHRLAHKEDIWLHTLNIPGSHVVIKDANPTEETLIEAAQLAAYYSKARHSESVPVDYTKVKYVKKPTGAKPGFVTYTEQKTLYVKPKKLAEH